MSHSWELPSNSGHERATWTVVEVNDKSLRCDVELHGQYYGEAFGPTAPEFEDYGLRMRGLIIERSTLVSLLNDLVSWLDLPLEELRSRSLELECGMGGLFDQYLSLKLGQRSDTISGGHPVATLNFYVGRLQGELSYVTDQSCLRSFTDDLRRALHAS